MKVDPEYAVRSRDDLTETLGLPRNPITKRQASDYGIPNDPFRELYRLANFLRWHFPAGELIAIEDEHSKQTWAITPSVLGSRSDGSLTLSVKSRRPVRRRTGDFMSGRSSTDPAVREYVASQIPRYSLIASRKVMSRRTDGGAREADVPLPVWGLFAYDLPKIAAAASQYLREANMIEEHTQLSAIVQEITVENVITQTAPMAPEGLRRMLSLESAPSLPDIDAIYGFGYIEMHSVRTLSPAITNLEVQAGDQRAQRAELLEKLYDHANFLTAHLPNGTSVQGMTMLWQQRHDELVEIDSTGRAQVVAGRFVEARRTGTDEATWRMFANDLIYLTDAARTHLEAQELDLATTAALQEMSGLSDGKLLQDLNALLPAPTAEKTQPQAAIASGRKPTEDGLGFSGL